MFGDGTSNLTPRNTAQLLKRWEHVLRVLKSMTPHERKKHFRMDRWGEKTACGTVGCAAGHCGLDPWFRRRGLKLQLEKNEYTGKIESTWDFDSDVIDFFGSEGAERVFYRTSSTHKSIVKYTERYIRDLKALIAADKAA